VSTLPGRVQYGIRMPHQKQPGHLRRKAHQALTDLRNIQSRNKDGELALELVIKLKVPRSRSQKGRTQYLTAVYSGHAGELSDVLLTQINRAVRGNN
jgi:hypothetical protein